MEDSAWDASWTPYLRVFRVLFHSRSESVAVYNFPRFNFNFLFEES